MVPVPVPPPRAPAPAPACAAAAAALRPPPRPPRPPPQGSAPMASPDPRRHRASRGRRLAGPAAVRRHPCPCLRPALSAPAPPRRLPGSPTRCGDGGGGGGG